MRISDWSSDVCSSDLIGCGDGELIAALRDKGVDARGLEIDPSNVTAAIARGQSVVQGDANRDLIDYPADGFDYAILSQTLQTTERPDRVVGELLRIAPRAFVSFPNFAHWRHRLALLRTGRMPVTRQLALARHEITEERPVGKGGAHTRRHRGAPV